MGRQADHWCKRCMPCSAGSNVKHCPCIQLRRELSSGPCLESAPGGIALVPCVAQAASSTVVWQVARRARSPSRWAGVSHAGGFMRHFRRRCSISAIQTGTCVPEFGLNGPNVPCTRAARCSGAGWNSDWQSMQWQPRAAPHRIDNQHVVIDQVAQLKVGHDLNQFVLGKECQLRAHPSPSCCIDCEDAANQRPATRSAATPLWAERAAPCPAGGSSRV